MSTTGILTAVCIALAAPAPAIAQCAETEIAMWGGPQDDSDYGEAVAVSGDLALVGAPRWRPGVGLPPEGMVTLAEWNGASWDASQVPSLNEMWSEYGSSVAINEAGDMLAVGAPGSSQFGSQTGMVLLYQYDGGVTGMMMGIGLGTGDELGSSVDASGDLVVAGAIGQGTGYVHVYRRLAPGSWTYETTLWAATSGEEFGAAVAVSGDRIAVGAPRRYDSTLGFVGAVTVFEHDGASWVPILELVGDAWQQQLGSELDLCGDVMVIGSKGANGGTGQAWLGRWVDGIWEDLLTMTAPTANWQLGAAVAVSDSRCAIGVPRYQQAPPDTVGGVELAHHVPGFPTPWNLSASTLVSGVPADQAYFGSAVALSGTRLVVSSPGAEDAAGDTVGRVVSIEIDDSIGFADLGHELAGYGGQAPTLAGHAPPCLEPKLYKVVTGARPLAIAHLVLGFAELDASFKGGVMVPTPDLLVSPLPIDGGGMLALSSPLPTGLPPVTITTQLWVEDVDGPAGFSASNGLRSDIPSY